MQINRIYMIQYTDNHEKYIKFYLFKNKFKFQLLSYKIIVIQIELQISILRAKFYVICDNLVILYLPVLAFCFILLFNF